MLSDDELKRIAYQAAIHSYSTESLRRFEQAILSRVGARIRAEERENSEKLIAALEQAATWLGEAAQDFGNARSGLVTLYLNDAETIRFVAHCEKARIVYADEPRARSAAPTEQNSGEGA